MIKTEKQKIIELEAKMYCEISDYFHQILENPYKTQKFWNKMCDIRIKYIKGLEDIEDEEEENES